MPVHIVKRSFRVNMSHLDHAGAHTKMRQTEFLCNCQSDLLVLFAFMRIGLEHAALFRQQFPHKSKGHQQAIGSAIRLLFHPVYRIAGLFSVLGMFDFLRLHALNIIVMHFLQAEEQIVLIVMDALVKDIEIRILLFDIARIDHDGIGRNFSDFGLFPFFRDLDLIINQEENTVHLFMLMKRQMQNG